MDKRFLVSGVFCGVVAAGAIAYSFYNSRLVTKQLDEERKQHESDAQKQIIAAKKEMEYEKRIAELEFKKRIAELEADKKIAEAKQEIAGASSGGGDKKVIIVSGRVVLDEVFDIIKGSKRPFALNLEKGGVVEVGLNVQTGPGIGLLLADEIAVQSSVGASSVSFKKKGKLGAGKWSLIACGVDPNLDGMSAKSTLKMLGALASGQWWVVAMGAASEMDKDSDRGKERSRVRLVVGVKENEQVEDVDMLKQLKSIDVSGEIFDSGLINHYAALKSVTIRNNSSARLASMRVEATYRENSTELGKKVANFFFTEKPIEPNEATTLRIYNPMITGNADYFGTIKEEDTKIGPIKKKANIVTFVVLRAFEYATFE